MKPPTLSTAQNGRRPRADRGGNGTAGEQVADEIRAAGGAAAPCFLPVDDCQVAVDIIGQCANAFGRAGLSADVLRERKIWSLGEDSCHRPHPATPGTAPVARDRYDSLSDAGKLTVQS